MNTEKNNSMLFTKVKPPDEKTDEVSPSWKTLLYDYTQETTLHGLRYVTVTTAFKIRRLFWVLILLAALGLFLSLVADKIKKLMSYPKTVNVEVNYNQSMAFPAVTICNANLYTSPTMPYLTTAWPTVSRLTALQKEGLYDIFINEYPRHHEEQYRDKETHTLVKADCVERYSLHFGICGIPQQNTYQKKSLVGVAEKWLMEFGEVTRGVCQHMCSQLYALSCNSVLFNRDNRTCVLSSYAGISEPISCSRNHNDNPYELYLKHRCVAEAGFECNFEKTRCSKDLQNDLTADDLWTVVTGTEVGKPEKDSTMDSGHGHFLYLLETDNRLNYNARYHTDYLNTTGKCLHLSYTFVGNDHDTRLSVLAVGVDKAVTDVRTVYNEVHADSYHDKTIWYQLYGHLPAGIQLVIIEGIRGPKYSAGIAVDDVKIMDCVTMTENCKQTNLGKEYIGTQSVTESGKSCLRWADLKGFDSPFYPDDLPDISIEAAENYCRSEAFSEVGPACYVDHDVLSADSYEECNITFCACGEDEFKCGNKFCLPDVYTCDGYDDCGDGTDEWQPCGEETHIWCHFDDHFICGYQRSEFGTLYWRRVSSSVSELGNIPTHHPLADSGHRWYLLISSSRGEAGDRAYFHSPMKESKKPMNLSFYLFMDHPEFDLLSRFEIYKTENGVMTQRLFENTHRDPHWQFFSVLIPEGIYLLTFVGVMGTPFKSDIGFASVTVKEVAVGANISKVMKSHVNCSIDFEEDCGYSQFGNSYLFRYDDFPKQSLDQFFHYYDDIIHSTNCGGVHLHTEGTVTSPHYPEIEYPKHSYCVDTIIVPAGLQLNLTFLFLDVEASAWGGCNDYVKIYVFDGVSWVTNVTWMYCQHKHEPLPVPLVLQGLMVRVDFYSDYIEECLGFELHYEMIGTLTTKDMALGSIYTGLFTLDEYFTTLSTPSFWLSMSHCLTVIIYSISNLTIYRQISDQDGRRTIKPLLSAPGHLGHAWHRIAIDLSPEYVSSSIWIKSSIHSAIDSYTCAIDSVFLSPTPCKTLYGGSGSMECGFEDIGMCGYVDQSRGSLKWIRTKWADKGSHSGSNSADKGGGNGTYPHYWSLPHQHEYAMSVNVVPYERAYAQMLSPAEWVPRSTCLLFDSGLELTQLTEHMVLHVMDFYVYKVDESTGIRKALTGRIKDFQPGEWWSMQVSLAAGTYRLQFEVHPTLPDYIMVEQTAGIVFRVANVTLADGDCPDPTSPPIDNIVNKATVVPVINVSEVTPIPVQNTSLQEAQVDIYDLLGPEHNYYEFLLGINKDLTTPEAEKLLGHSKSHFFVSCGWGGEKSNCEPIASVSTGTGYCYTFNPYENGAKSTNRTGADFGLSVLINIEHYEYTEVIEQTDAGIKVHLHTQYDVPSVSDLGFAVFPGTHAYASVTVSQTESLEAPWGTCSSIPLYNSTRYTRLRCQKQCHSNATFSVCSCTETIMHGQADACFINETMNCVIPNQTKILQERSECENSCPDACEVTSLPVSLSYSDMSGEGLLAHFTQRQIDDFYEHHENAVNIRHRVTSKLMEQTLETVLHVIGNYTSFFDYVYTRVLDGSTSVVIQLAKAVNKFLDVADFEINSKFFGQLDYMVETYENATAPRVNSLQFEFAEAKAFLFKLNSALKMKLEGSSQVQQEFWETLPDQVKESVDCAFTSYLLFNELDGVLDLDRSIVPYLSNLTNDVTEQRLCQHFDSAEAKHDVDEFLEIIIHNVDDFKSNASLPPNLEQNVIKGLEHSQEIYEGLGHLDKCVSGYEKLIHSLQIWRNQLEFTHVTPKEIDTDSIVIGFKYTLEWFDKMLEDYAKNEISKHELAELVLGENITDIVMKIEMLLTVYKNRISPDIKGKIEEKYLLMRKQYQEALSYLSQLDAYFTDGHFEKAGRSINLWLKPYPVIDSPQIISYVYNKGEGWHTWPRTMTLAEFEHYMGPATIRRLTKGYFDSLQSRLTDMDTELEIRQNALINAISQLQTFFRNYNNDLSINAHFVKQNFLHLNVFFGELKYEFVKQLRGYDVATLFSEIGGYMGLLIGGSAITVVEFLDLLIYNCLRKGLERKGKTNVIKVQPMKET